jgi:hypothetical protein
MHRQKFSGANFTAVPDTQGLLQQQPIESPRVLWHGIGEVVFGVPVPLENRVTWPDLELRGVVIFVDHSRDDG